MSTYSFMLSFRGYPLLAPLLAPFLIVLDLDVFRGAFFSFVFFADSFGLPWFAFLGISLIFTGESLFNGLFEVRCPAGRKFNYNLILKKPH